MEEVSKKQVDEYIESEMRCKVISSKPETTIKDMGYDITIWNVKTDVEGSWWVATGDLPINLYPQDKPYFFTTDEVFSFHVGLMMRLQHGNETNSAHVIDFLSGKIGVASEIRRKLELASEKLNDAIEVEDFQSVGVICRETLLKLIEIISKSELVIDFESLKMADFKGRIETIIKKISPGKGNKILRKTIKDLAFGTWDISNKLTHSSKKSKHDAGVCLTLTVALVTSIEHLLLKYYDILADEKCKECGSRNLTIYENEENDDLLIVCERCSHGHLKSM